MTGRERRLRKELQRNWQAILKERDHSKARGLHRDRERLQDELRQEVEDAARRAAAD